MSYRYMVLGDLLSQLQFCAMGQTPLRYIIVCKKHVDAGTK